MYSNLVLKGYLLMIVLDIWRRDYLENLNEKVVVKSGLLMVLMVVIMFLVVMRMLLYP